MLMGKSSLIGAKHNVMIMQEDLYYPQTFAQDLFWKSAHMFSENILNRWPFNKLIREKAIGKAMELIHYHDEATQYITGGAVPKVNDGQ